MKRQLGTAQERLEELERMLKVDHKIIQMMGAIEAQAHLNNSKLCFQINLNRTETLPYL